MSRTGIGIDVHPLAAGRDLVLGGITIPFESGLDGHSDGDVLVHAIIDALLGAAGLGDIGLHFPSSDDRYKGIASTKLLPPTLDLLNERRWRTTYVDATILAEQPVLRPYMARIRESLAEGMGVSTEESNVKATTTEGLGIAGSGGGSAALAVAAIAR